MAARFKADTALMADKVMTYTINLTVTRTIAANPYDSESTVENVSEWMASREAKREIEKEVLAALNYRMNCRRIFDGFCDCEVLEAQS